MTATTGTKIYTLRMKGTAKMSALVTFLLSNSDRFVTLEELKGKGFKPADYWRLRHMAGQIDNLTVKTSKDGITVRYAELAPVPVSVPVPVETTSFVAAGAVATPAVSAAEHEDIRWPSTPMVPDGMGSRYKEPSWFKVMETMVLAGRHISLAGAPGTGKDVAVIELASIHNKPLVFIGGDAGFRRRDLVGSPQISNGHSFMEVGEYAAAAINGWWVCLSEVNAADADALMFINQQLAAPYVVNIAGKSYPVHPDFRLFVTYNPGLVGTKPLPQSFKDRFFSITVPWFTGAQLKALLSSHGLPAEPWAEDLVNTAMEIEKANERGSIRYQITSRRLQDAIVVMNSGVFGKDLEKAMEMAVVSSIDSPVEAKTVRQIISSCKANWLSTRTLTVERP